MPLGEQPSYAEEAANSLSGLKILVVDDEEDSRVLFKYIFENFGAAVLAVDSAQQALAVIKQWQPNLLISDIAMPHEDGHSLIRKVRSLKAEHGGQVPAIAITGCARDVQPVKPRRQAFNFI